MLSGTQSREASSPPLAVLGNSFPSRLCGIVEFILHLLDAVVTSNQEPCNDQWILLVPSFFKLFPRLIFQQLVPRLPSFLICPMKVLGCSQNFPVQAQRFPPTSPCRQVLVNSVCGRCTGDPDARSHDGYDTK